MKNEFCLVNIKELLCVGLKDKTKLMGKEMDQAFSVPNAYLHIKDGRITSYGQMHQFNQQGLLGINIIDVKERYVFPAFVDSHTHLVFAGSREGEFVDKIKGLSYAEIAAKGGGILNSAKRLQNTTEQELFEAAKIRLEEILQTGTGAVEIKSGYGLTLEDELKMLRVIQRLKESSPVTIRSTFLGAHAVPKGLTKVRYIRLIVEEMLPAVAAEKLADYCDVFCEEGFFTEEETILISKAALKHGIRPKIHANQLNRSGGVQAGVAVGAISVDHLESIDDQEINLLKKSETMPTLLPGAAFFLRLAYPPARKLIAADLPIAIASDFNPGSSPNGDMQLMMSLACIQMRLTPTEALHAATINGAYAIDLSDQLGSIDIGKKANIIISKSVNSFEYIPYAYGRNHIEKIIINGEFVKM